MFTLLKTTSLGRRGILETAHGTIQTPFFMPVGTAGAMRGMSHHDLLSVGAQILLCNTYHLMLRPSAEVVEEAGGLHKFIGWNKPILTDSGGYQVFSLRNISTITDKGVDFRSHINGDKYFLGPEEAMRIQHQLSADMIMCFDECPPSTASRDTIEKAVDRTLRWAKECKRVHEKMLEQRQQGCCRGALPGFAFRATSGKQCAPTARHHQKPLLFGIVQGGIHFYLRKKCAEELIAIGFDGYAIGGLAVGEGESEMFDVVREMFDVVRKITPLLPTDKPRYLMGVGKTEQLKKCVALGIDMFDCVLPTRIGRHGKILLTDGTSIEITQNKFKNDHTPIDPDSPSVLSHKHTKSYLRHLIMAGERYGETIATMQNIAVTLDVMRKLRNSMDN